MVWYGMVWYGMVWYGMVWYGMVCVDDVGRLLAWLCFVFSSTLFVIVAFRADGSREG